MLSAKPSVQLAILPAAATSEPREVTIPSDATGLLVHVHQFGANKAGVKKIAFEGGPELEEKAFASGGLSPYPAEKYFLLSEGCPTGKATLEVTKDTGVEAVLIVEPLVADGPILVGAHGEGSGSGAEPAVPALTISGPGLLRAIVGSAQSNLPTDQSYPALGSATVGGTTFAIQGTYLYTTGSVVAAWAFPEKAANARAGIFLLDPNPPPPPSSIDIDFETGNKSQAEYEQAIKEPEPRITVVTSPHVDGAYAGRFEVREGDVEPDTGSNRAEFVVGLEYHEGDERWFRLAAEIVSRDEAHWSTGGQQIHDTGSGGSPAVSTMMEGPTYRLQNGKGSEVWWDTPVVLGARFELIYRLKVSSTAGEIGDVIYNGVPQLLKTGLARKVGLAFSNLPLYDKIGLYRSNLSAGTAVLLIGAYEVDDKPIAPRFRVSHGGRFVSVKQGGLLRPALIRA